MSDAERRNMWADRIERCLASDMTIKQWCKLNHVGASSLYKWMARFREEEPERFPRRSSIATNWMEVVRGGIADSKAMVPAVAAACGQEAASAGPHPADAANSPSLKSYEQGSGAPIPLPIRALVGRVELAIPPGSAGCDIASAMRAAASL